MEMSIGRDIAALRRMTVKQLQAKYAEAFGEPTTGRNKAWLVKRVAWRLQARAEGGLSDRARKRAAELADDADLRLTPPRPKPATTPAAVEATFAPGVSADDRLPPPGTLLVRGYKGGRVAVLVRPDGFEFEGEVFASLSAAAKHITGSHCNGFRFFRLTDGKEDAS
jgi:hypothetical protein